MSLPDAPMSLTDAPFSPQDALVAVMITVSASDGQMRTAELVAIERIVNHLPIFGTYNATRIRAVSDAVMGLLAEEDGLDQLFNLLRGTLSERLYETAYAVACDVAVADGTLREPELRMLQEIREELRLSNLHAAAIELSARARHVRP